MKNAQSALEYLLLIGGAILVGVISIALLINITTSSEEEIIITSAHALCVKFPQNDCDNHSVSVKERNFHCYRARVDRCRAAVGLVASWHMNGAPDGNTADDSGFGNHGQLFGETTCDVSGHYGNGCFFDQSVDDDYILSTDTPELSGGAGKNFSWSFWMNPKVDPLNDFLFIITKSLNGSNKDWEISHHNGTHNLVFYYEAGSGNDGPCPCSSTAVAPTNVWTHVAMTYSGGTRELRIYVNGNFDSSFILGNDLIDTTQGVTIGKRPYQALQGFEGYLDEVTIWNRVLSEDEIRSISQT